MSRKVYITTDMSLDEGVADVADLDGTVALLWPWFLLAFDDWGRASASPRRLKAQLFPMNRAVSEKVIEKALEAFDEVGLITLYLVGEHPYMAIAPEKWFAYQTQIHKDKRERDGSHFPAPTETSISSYAESRGIPRSTARNRASSLPPSTLLPPPSGADAPRSEEFDSFWSAYPRKEGKGQAKRAWAGALRKAPPDVVMAGLAAQLPSLAARERQYIPLPATWLNGERWGDEVAGNGKAPPSDPATWSLRKVFATHFFENHVWMCCELDSDEEREIREGIESGRITREEVETWQ
jgi:hypothetical protein